MEVLEIIERFIRTGRLREARSNLKEISLEGFTRKERLYFANLARRASLPHLALRALRRFVRPSELRPEVATDAEKVEYAASLNWLGLSSEAATLLEETNSFPSAKLIRAFVAFGEWDYAHALILLEDYLREDLPSYDRLIGSVNLLSAYVHEQRFAEAAYLSARLREDTSRHGYWNLHFNTLKQELEMLVTQREWVRARLLADEIRATQENMDGHSKLFIEKWLALEPLYEAPQRTENWKTPLEAVKSHARALQHWETLRDCDFHEAIATKNSQLGAKVLWGTPHGAYRRRFMLQGPELYAEFPEEILVYFDEWEGSIQTLFMKNPRSKLAPYLRNTQQNPSRVPLRLLQALSCDFYAPKTIPQLFGLVFPDRFFSDHSANVMHQALHRTRRFLASTKLIIRERREHFYLVGQTAVVLPRPDSKSREDEFSCADWARRHGLSLRQAQREIADLVNRGKAEKLKVGRRVSYRLHAR